MISYLDGCYNQSLVHKRVQGVGVGLSEISCKVGPHPRVPHSNFDQALFSELNDLKVKVRPENKMDLIPELCLGVSLDNKLSDIFYTLPTI